MSSIFLRATYTFFEAEAVLVGLGLDVSSLRKAAQPGMLHAHVDGAWGGWPLTGDGLEALARCAGLVDEETAGRVADIEAAPPAALPRFCYVAVGIEEVARARVALVFRGESGARDKWSHATFASARQHAREMNRALGVSDAQAAAMAVGAFDGWASPWTDPSRYTHQGRPIFSYYCVEDGESAVLATSNKG